MKKLLIASSANVLLAAASLLYEPGTVWDYGFGLGAK
jgi:hypothetical protein